jgi:hypothetical protein
LDRNLSIRPISKLSFEEKVAQIQRSAGNMGDLSPVMPRSWIGHKGKIKPLDTRFFPREKETAENEIPSASPRA